MFELCILLLKIFSVVQVFRGCTIILALMSMIATKGTFPSLNFSLDRPATFELCVTVLSFWAWFL